MRLTKQGLIDKRTVRDTRGEKHFNWKGGRKTDPKGYVYVYAPGHPRQRRGYAPEHVLIAEKALGKFIENLHPIHHWDENTGNNLNPNLLICEDKKYHKLIHRRMVLVKLGCDPRIESYCRSCSGIKPLCEFSAKAASSTGIDYVCRRCISAKNAEDKLRRKNARRG
jgi:hypothetical protein